MAQGSLGLKPASKFQRCFRLLGFLIRFRYFIISMDSSSKFLPELSG